MKQVLQSFRTGRLKLADVPAPQVTAGHILVATRASLISAGTERMVMELAQKSLLGKARARPDLVRKTLDKAKRDGLAATFRAVMARLDEPLPLGYSAAGRVVAVGAGLEGRFQIGQRVAMAGAGLANHAEINRVPANLAVPISDSLPDQEACYATLAAIALQGVRNLNLSLGETVAVVGVGLVGQLACQLVTLAGGRALALDYDPARLELAMRLGAERAWNLADPNGLAETVSAITNGLGVDGILIAAATDSSEPLALAADIARDRARVALVGKTGTAFPFAEYMKKELTIITSRSYGPGRYDDDYELRGVKYPPGFVRWTETENLAECLRLMNPARKLRLDTAALTTHRFMIEDAEKAYDLIGAGTEPHLGVVLTYAETDAPLPSPKAFAATSSKPKDACRIGMIGAGAFARSVLLPELTRHAGVALKTLVTQRGASAEHGREIFGFAEAATDIDAVLADPEIDAVLIATRHDSHAGLTARALEAGKSVLVEKPLALDREGLAQVAAARENAAGFFLVGFNRRFAPFSLKLRQMAARHAGAKFVLMRINAGPLGIGSWVAGDTEGGGRILGELCHFVDLARFIIGSEIQSVQAEAARPAAGPCDDVTVTLAFQDGSLATLAYTGRGDSAQGKERIELFAGGSAAVIEDFRELAIASGGKARSEKSRIGQDKGHRAEIAAFVEAVKSGGPAPTDEAELLETSLATLAILESLRASLRVVL